MKPDAFAGLMIGLFVACLAGPASAQQPPAETTPVTDAISIADLAKAPSVTLNNGLLSAKIYLPDAQKGFYRGARFDWAGVVGGLTYRRHDFYVPWFQSMSPRVRDFIFQDGAVIASPNTAATGPVEEFNAEGGALGYAEAAPGGLFLKIGVGVLRRLDDAAYGSFRQYPIVDGGKRTTQARRDRVTFTHEAAEAGSGYGYHYTKTLRLEAGQPVLLIEHVLRNTGAKTITTTVYNHNFLNIDGKGTAPGLVLETAFPLKADKAPDPSLAQIEGDRVLYRARPANDQRIAARLTGYGPTAADNGFHITQAGQGVGVRITGDQPLSRVYLWSVAPVMSIEPFVSMSIAPGQSFSWSYRYAYEAP